ncbi:hypothetical protein FHW69_001619 [Luteibacter sp. Sphag1AF]|uniref:hypothetical protein n=1 Tax=Luteibacter sp. Sphag1AF TaxID=2587031 RepID=UPI001611F33C|nr:hypothetical protein [Luteibacter sp. Sphag1AF]MBB3227018.1 hypothetical protein [Luteibacter sp. Sphag1AF]
MTNTINIKAALSRIAMTSDLCSREQRRPNDAICGWNSGEAALLFGLYERAVLDHFGVHCGNRLTDLEFPSAEVTAKTGFIKTRKGGRVNILELLGIEPAWAWAQIQRAADYTERKAA